MCFFQNSSQQSSQKDYKALYQAQRGMRKHYEKKSKIIEIKLKKTIQGKYKKSLEAQLILKKDNSQIIEELKNFKIDIPQENINRLQDIKVNKSILDQKIINNFAIYGIPNSLIRQSQQNYHNILQGQVLFTSDIPSQIVMHSSKLVFPSDVIFNKIYGIQARDRALEIVSQNYNLVKSFILSFQPPQGQILMSGRKSKQVHNPILSILNPQKRMYAICLSIPQYTYIPQNLNLTYSLEDTDQQYQKNNKTKYSSCTDTDTTDYINDDLCLGFSQRVYCIFTNYPIFPFFENILKSMINIVKMERMVLFKQSQSLEDVDSNFFERRIKEIYYYHLEQMSKLISLQLESIYQVKFITHLKVTLNTDLSSVNGYYVQDWIYPILRIFNVDSFLDIFTLIMLQEKIVFVCQNSHILTYIVYLFTNILPKPFFYPYPVVTMIPDQQQYLNAPFPVVYGYLKSKKNIISQNYHKIYKNTYVFVTPKGIEILSQQSKKSILNKKSLKLRQKLVPWFEKLNIKKIQKKNNILQFEETNQFNFSYNQKDIDTAMIILKQVSYFMQRQIHSLIPSKLQVQKIRKQLSKDIDFSQDITQQIFKKIIISYHNRSKDPFFGQFLQTQLLNVYLFL